MEAKHDTPSAAGEAKDDTSSAAMSNDPVPNFDTFVMDSTPYPITMPSCSARDDDDKPCPGIPYISCPRCYLVTYCAEECRKADWDSHKPECYRDLSVTTSPAIKNVDGDHTSFWAKYAATDVLNLEKNEGKHFDGFLKLLFTGDSTLRNFIYTLLQCPDTAQPRLNVSIVESSVVHLTRTLYAILLLFNANHDPVLNAEAVMHMWYSAKMPRALFKHIENVVTNSISGYLEDVHTYYDINNSSKDSRYKAEWSMYGINIKAHLNHEEWLAMAAYLKLPSKIQDQEAKIMRAVDLMKNAEPPEIEMSRMTRSRALGMLRWRHDGMLLPFGQHRDDFDTLNPLFFQDDKQYPTGATAEPLSEWPMELLDCPDCPATNDVYGKMFYYVRDLLVRFQHRSKSFDLNIEVLSETMVKLSTILSPRAGHMPFDRIEVGNSWDNNPFATFVAMSGLLRHTDENPHATLLTLSRESVTTMCETLQKDMELEERSMYEEIGTVLDTYAPPLTSEGSTNISVQLRRSLGLMMWRNWNRFSAQYLNVPQRFAFRSLGHPDQATDHRSVFETGLLGLSIMPKNSITRRWPNRLVHGAKDAPTERDFNRWIGWASKCPERWLEWKKSEDVEPSEWEKWMGIARAREKVFIKPQILFLDKSETPKVKEAEVEYALSELNLGDDHSTTATLDSKGEGQNESKDEAAQRQRKSKPKKKKKGASGKK